MHSKCQPQAHLGVRDHPTLPPTESFQDKKTRRGAIAKERWKASALALMLLMAAMMISSVSGQSSNSTEIQIMIEMGEGVDPVSGEQHSRQSTIFDGVTGEKYITYLKLDANQSAGVRTTIGDLDTLSRPIDYTVMLWFKPQDVAFWG
jgi:hypothetical protein